MSNNFFFNIALKARQVSSRHAGRASPVFFYIQLIKSIKLFIPDKNYENKIVKNNFHCDCSA
jgi:hypothetical protein